MSPHCPTLVGASLCNDTCLGGDTAPYAWNPHSIPTIHSHPWLGPLPKGLTLAFGPSACVCVCERERERQFSGLCDHAVSLCICVLVGGLLKAGYAAHKGFPGGASGKESACQRTRHKRHRFDPWAGKIPWRGNGSPLQYSCWENPMDRGAWRPTVHGVAKNRTRLSR